MEFWLVYSINYYLGVVSLTIRNGENKFLEICKKANLKVTPQRQTIFNVLSETDDHPSVEMVYKKVKKIFPNISFDTVNRTLNTFVEIGIAFVVEGDAQVRRFDGGLDPHQHFKCIKCKRIFDFHWPGFDNIERPEGLGEGFEVLKTQIYFQGICKDCNSKGNNYQFQYGDAK